MKKKTIVRVAAIILAFAAVSVFGLFAAENNPQEAEAADTRVAAAAEEAEKQGKKDTKARETETPEKGVDTSTQEKKANGGNQQPEQKVKKPETGTATGQKAASGSTGKTGQDSQGGGTGKDAANETKPVHTHEWAAVYGERTVHKTEQKFYAAICNQCGLDMSSFTEDAIWDHIHNTACNSFSTDVYKDIAVEQNEQYISGYTCSCGAKKE